MEVSLRDRTGRSLRTSVNLIQDIWQQSHQKFVFFVATCKLDSKKLKFGIHFNDHNIKMSLSITRSIFYQSESTSCLFDMLYTFRCHDLQRCDKVVLIVYVFMRINSVPSIFLDQQPTSRHHRSQLQPQQQSVRLNINPPVLLLTPPLQLITQYQLIHTNHRRLILNQWSVTEAVDRAPLMSAVRGRYRHIVIRIAQ